MAYTQYWSERDSFVRRQERAFRNELIHEVYYNHMISVYRLKNGKYAVTDYKPDQRDGNDILYLAEPDMILRLIADPDLWKLFVLNAINCGDSIKLDSDGYSRMRNFCPDGAEPDEHEMEFREALKAEQEEENAVREKEKIVGTPEWRQSVEREIHQMTEQDRARLKNKPAIAIFFLEPSVRKRLKDEKAYIYKEQNHRIYEAQEAERVIEEGMVSKNTLLAGVVSIVGILLFYLLISLRVINLQFVPALICGIISGTMLLKDQNYDKKNMNARLPVWIITIICFMLGLIAVVSMLS